MNSRRTGWLLVLALLCLNWLLFVPAAAFHAGPPADLLPFTPKEHPGGAWGFDLRSAVEYPKALLLRRANLDVFRGSVEFLWLVVLLVATAKTRVARAVRVVLAVSYLTFLVLLTYHHAYAHFYRVEPALWEDVDLVTSLLRYLRSELGLGVVIGGASAIALILGALWAGSLKLFGAVQSAVQGRRPLVTSLMLAGWGVVSVLWFGADRDDPVMQLRSKVLRRNLEASLSRRAKVMALRGAPPDRRYEPLLRARLERKPRVYLLMIEAYGQRLASDPQLEGAFREVTTRVMDRLGASGFHARTAYSRAPVYGGRSWLSIGTVQTGVRIETPSIYDEMAKVGPRIPTLTRFFDVNGYRTLALQSGNFVKDAKLTDAFARDVVVEDGDLPFKGQRIGYGGIPDQYALSWFRENVLEREKEPFFAFYMSVSTHFSWPEIPFAADWKKLDEPAPPVLPMEPLPQLAALPDGLPARYVASVNYEWRALADFIESETSQDAIFFVVGDHQPLLERTMDDVAELARQQSLNTPVHVISRDAAFVERFARLGFSPGLFAPAGTGKLMHEGLFSLFVTELVAHLGARGENRFTAYAPEGSSLSAFSPE